MASFRTISRFKERLTAAPMVLRTESCRDLISDWRNKLAFSTATARCSDIDVNNRVSSLVSFRGDRALKSMKQNTRAWVLIGKTAKKHSMALNVALVALNAA